MPISRTEFNTRQGRTIEPLEEEVQRFLRINSEQAYTPIEILTGIGGGVVNPLIASRVKDIAIALENLIVRGKVMGKVIPTDLFGVEERYFMINPQPAQVGT